MVKHIGTEATGVPRDHPSWSAVVDNYVYIHNAFRNHLESIIALVGRNRLTKAAVEFENWSQIMELHAQVEDEVFMPALRSRGFEVPECISAMHTQLHADTVAVAAKLEAVDQANAAAALSTLRSTLMIHLLDEERLIMPAMVAHFTVDELWALDSIIVNPNLGYCDKPLLIKITMWWLGNISFWKEGIPLFQNFGKAAKLGSLTYAEWEKLIGPVLADTASPSPLRKYRLDQIAGDKLVPPTHAAGGGIQPAARMFVGATPLTEVIIEGSPDAGAAKIAAGTAVTLEHVSYSVQVGKQTKTLLTEVSGAFCPRRMCALIGPSGCGKTTLLDVVSGRKTQGHVAGRVLYGGESQTLCTMRNAVGYVEQHDTLAGELTVHEMLTYAAALKLPKSTRAAERASRVDELISTLGLKSCAKTLIGSHLNRGISGGEAKRVSIALALVTRPSVLFLDEPTSGLDAHLANEVCHSLAQLAADGCTIACTIHSPTSYAFSLFDDLMLLHHGRVSYHGPTADVAEYLTSTIGVAPRDAGRCDSLPEWLIETTAIAVFPASEGKREASRAGRAIEWAALFAASPQAKVQAAVAADAAKASLSAPLARVSDLPGPLKKLATILRYRATAHYKSNEFLGPRIGDKLTFGPLMLALYWGIADEADPQAIQSSASFLMYVVILSGYGAQAFTPTLFLDRPLFYHELADGCYSPMVYYLSKFLEEAFLCIFTSLLFSAIVFFGVQLQGSFWLFAAIYYLTSMVGICLAYAVAAISPTMEACNALYPIAVTSWMFFGGLFITLDKIPVYLQWLSWTSFFRFSWGALMHNQFDTNAVGEHPAFWSDTTNSSVTVLEFYDLTATDSVVMGSLGACVALLVACTLAFATCGASSLIYMRHDKR